MDAFCSQDESGGNTLAFSQKDSDVSSNQDALARENKRLRILVKVQQAKLEKRDQRIEAFQERILSMRSSDGDTREESLGKVRKPKSSSSPKQQQEEGDGSLRARVKRILTNAIIN